MLGTKDILSYIRAKAWQYTDSKQKYVIISTILRIEYLLEALLLYKQSFVRAYKIHLYKYL